MFKVLEETLKGFDPNFTIIVSIIFIILFLLLKSLDFYREFIHLKNGKYQLDIKKTLLEIQKLELEIKDKISIEKDSNNVNTSSYSLEDFDWEKYKYKPPTSLVFYGFLLDIIGILGHIFSIIILGPFGLVLLAYGAGLIFGYVDPSNLKGVDIEYANWVGITYMFLSIFLIALFLNSCKQAINFIKKVFLKIISKVKIA